MTSDAIPYGLLKRAEVVVGDVSPAAATARKQAHAATQARLEAFDRERLTHEVECISYYVASDRFRHQGTLRWTLRPDDRTRAATLAIHPLPYMPIEALIRAGIIDWHGVVEEEWKKACEERRL